MEFKKDLDNICQLWQEKIESGDVNSKHISNANALRLICMERIKIRQDMLEWAILTTGDKEDEKALTMLIEELGHFEMQLNEKHENFLSEQKRVFIQQFEKFTADESFVGDQCVICMEDIEIGRNMMRLDQTCQIK